MSIILLGIGSVGANAEANPLKYLKRTIKNQGYILYQTPLSASGTGTLVGGSPSSMSIVTDPQTCFPDLVNEVPSMIRKVQDTNLGSISQTTSFDGKVGLDLLKFMTNGNAVFKVGAEIHNVKSIELSFEGAKIEYIDTILLQEFYQRNMSENCKKSLNNFGFVIQALRVDQMRYAFRSETGGYIHLDTDAISKYFKIDVDVKFHIEKDYLLVIDTPKYIGYQLGRLQERDQGLSMYRAQKVRFDKYLFKSTSIFEN